MLIRNSKHDIGDEIDCGIHRRGYDEYRVTLRKLGEIEWRAYKFGFRTKKEIPLMKGDLKKIVNYVNSNFGYNDEVVD